MFKFLIDTSSVIKSVEGMKKDLYSKQFGYNIMLMGQKSVIEKNVKKRFKENIRKDPSANIDETDHKLSETIYNSIDTELLPFDTINKAWTVGTGNFDKLDKNSGGLLLKSLRSGNSYYLWRVLEKGARTHSIIPIQSKLLVFEWPRWGFILYTPKVKHPGQRGRNFFLTEMDALYKDDEAIVEKIYLKFNQIISKWSAN